MFYARGVLISFVFGLNLLLNLGFKVHASTSCVSKSFGYGSTVCVCNSTYCDFTSPPPDLKENSSYFLYTSDQAGARFDFKEGTFSLTEKEAVKGNGYEIYITRDFSTDQEILGFGGAFTDAAGINIKSLNNLTQEMLMRSYFSPEGISYNFGRVPIGGCDFSTRAYTYDDDAPGDTKLIYFNLTEEDYHYKIPFIHKANDLRGEPLKLIGSAWSAPAWMKTNNDLTGQGQLKREYFQTWAQFLILFLDFYSKENLKFYAITTGNEPVNGDVPDFLPFVPKFNSMGWYPRSVTDWIVQNLGPTLKSSPHNETKILAIDDQRFVLPWWLDRMVAHNKQVETFIDGVGVHWYWDQFISVHVIDQVHAKYPRLLLLNTEACIGDKPWDFIKVQLGSWNRAEMYVADIIENLQHGLVAWIEWNLALNKQGGPNWKKNYVDAPIIVDPDLDVFYKQPSFYAIGHFSKFIKPGSRVLKTEMRKSEIQVLATLEKDRKRVVTVLFNPKKKDIKVTIIDERKNRSLTLILSKRSITTLIYLA